MKHEAFKELRDIIKLQDWSEFCPEKTRAEKLEAWMNKWITEVEFSQAVVDTKYLTSEYNDTIKIKLAQSLAEDLAEECVTYKTKERKISATMCALRRRAK
jgi:hypothetical protein